MTVDGGHRQAGDAVVRKLVTFGRILREAGVEVGPGRLQDALRALDAIDLSVRDEVYSALVCTLVDKRDDLEKRIAKVDLPQVSAYAVAFRPDGQALAVAGGDGQARLSTGADA